MTYPLATNTWNEEEVEAIQSVIASGRYTMGPQVKAFEEAFAAHFGTRYAVMASSGSTANLLMLAALFYHPDFDLEEGDEVIVPAVSWSTTYFPVHQLRLSLRFVDVDPHTFNLDPEQVEAAITPRTKAVLAVNLLGNNADLPKLREICDRRGLVLLEDNCESMGARINGKFAGAYGLMGTFSTFFSHHICTMEGGVVITDDEAAYHTMLSLRAHGWTREQPEHSHLQIDADPFEKQFRFILPGYNFRPIEMSGAIGLVQLRKLPDFVAERRANADRFRAQFGNAQNIRLQSETGESSWFGFAMILEGPLASRRKDVVDALNSAGIESRPIIAGNFVRNPVISHLDHTIYGDLKNADEIDQCGLFVGNHHYPIAAEIEKLGETLRPFL